MRLPDIPISLNSSDNDLDVEFFTPCLEWANKYDRGVGYFTSGWISVNAKGLASFAGRGGLARWITSPILEEKDYNAIKSSNNLSDAIKYFQNLLITCVDQLAAEMEKETLNAFAWLIYDNILELKFAIPVNKLLDGDFHDKFGIFYDNNRNCLSFIGSINDSMKGFSNYESIKVFKSWEGMTQYVDLDTKRFEKLWNNHDSNLKIYECNDAIREKLIKLRKSDRPYTNKKPDDVTDLWIHQEKAVKAFIVAKNGILEMATGTGKTRTALKIILQLFNEGKIKRVIITMHGNDLLRQWEKEVLSFLSADIQVYKYFDSIYKELPSFLLCRSKCILIISRDSERLSECIDRMTMRIQNVDNETMFVFDEVHGLGSLSMRNLLSGKISPFQYRLGLSATPDREYNDGGNEFIFQEVGPVIFRFTLEDAIQKGILCEFSYIPLEYELAHEEKQTKRSIIARYAARRKSGELVNDEDMYRDLARVNKTSIAKLPLFQGLIHERPEVLDRCIIFVETREYGINVQNILIHRFPEFHTYYGDDEEENLRKFGACNLNCLITCKKISEGVDIKSVKNIILFSSDRGRLVTTQRIGRSLRTNPADPEKRANVVDFICINPESDNIDTEFNADIDRRDWLTELSMVRRISNEAI